LVRGGDMQVLGLVIFVILCWWLIGAVLSLIFARVHDGCWISWKYDFQDFLFISFLGPAIIYFEYLIRKEKEDVFTGTEYKDDK
jgi:hypothetical protein